MMRPPAPPPRGFVAGGSVDCSIEHEVYRRFTPLLVAMGLSFRTLQWLVISMQMPLEEVVCLRAGGIRHDGKKRAKEEVEAFHANHEKLIEPLTKLIGQYRVDLILLSERSRPRGSQRSENRVTLAGRAMQGMLAHPTRYHPAPGYPVDWHQAIAKEAFELADAMIAQGSVT
jgi:hypothetical protein